MQALAAALAGCMAIDVVDILLKGRHAVRGLSATLEAVRAVGVPARLTAVRLDCRVEGDVPSAAVDRAIQLSRDKYCSVWHSLRPDVEFVTTFSTTEER
jgi:putative redox protein